MNKKTGTLITVLIVLAIVLFRFYRKYEVQRIKDEKKKEQLEFYQKGQKYRDSIKRVKEDSIRRNKPTRRDSIVEENKKKAAELKKLLEKMEKEQ